MRTARTNHEITVLGKKIGNTYIKSREGNTYPISNTNTTKSIKDYTQYWWILKRHYFKWRVVNMVRFTE